MNFPLGDQTTELIELFSSVSYSFLAFSPSGPISQISRSPNLPGFAPKAMAEPSGEIPSAWALSRMWRGGFPKTENIQMLVPCELNSSGREPRGKAFTRNLVLSGNQP